MRDAALRLPALLLVIGLAGCEDHHGRADGGIDVPAGDLAGDTSGDATQDGLPAGTPVLGGDSAWVTNGDAVVTTVPVSGQPFDTARNTVTVGPYANVWKTQLEARNAIALDQGDVLLATFWARCEKSLLESGECKTEFVFERASTPWTKSVGYPVSVGKDWTQMFVRFKSAESYAPDAAHALFRLGYPSQTIQIAGITLVSYGKNVALEQLPTTTIHYSGEAADAPWRAEAEQRIEANRKGDLTIMVHDATGQPVTGATVTIKMKRHAFAFGTAISADFLKGGQTADGTRYRQEIVRLFNTVVEENALKWPALAGDWGAGWNLALAESAVDWARSQGLGVRGHNLVWPSWRNSPASLRAVVTNPDAGAAFDAGADAGETGPEVLKTIVRDHVTELAGALAGKLIHWDVVNEPFDNHDITDLVGGVGEMVEWFKLARQADPVAKLFINDYAILAGGGGTSAHRDFYEQIIKDLIAAGAPVDGIGMQGHFGLTVTAPTDAMAILDRFAKLGPEIWITEYDMVVDDLELAARYTRDILTVLFSHPKVGGFIMWGFWDGAHFAKNAPLFTQTWSQKPAGAVYEDLVLNRWWTDTSCTSGAAGSCQVRGFLGDYELTASAGGKTVTVTTSMPAKTGKSVTLTLP